MKRNGDHFGVGIISGPIWGSFQGWGSFRGLYSTAKERRLNQFGMAVLIRCGRNVKVDRVCRIIRHWSGMWFIRRSSQVPNLMHTLCIHWIYNFSHNTARFYVVAMPRTLNWEKRRVKRDNLVPLHLLWEGKIYLFCLREWWKVKLSSGWKASGLILARFSSSVKKKI